MPPFFLSGEFTSADAFRDEVKKKEREREREKQKSGGVI